jgi:GNAT superfamily N-acetyltransferase
MSVTVTRTYLEMRSPDELHAAPGPHANVTVAREPCTLALYRQLYAWVGSPHRWFERNSWPDERLAGYLAQPNVSVWILRVDGKPAGYFELVRHDDGSVEVAYFGLAPPYIGRGLGKFLLTRAVEEAWALGASRIWLHTCTLDHASALPNYLARGFRPYRTETYELDS